MGEERVQLPSPDRAAGQENPASSNGGEGSTPDPQQEGKTAMSGIYEIEMTDLYSTVSFGGGGGGGNKWGNLAETVCTATVATGFGIGGSSLGPVGTVTAAGLGAAIGAMVCDPLNGSDDFPG